MNKSSRLSARLLWKKHRSCGFNGFIPDRPRVSLLIDMHHIISDGLSGVILLDELERMYNDNVFVSCLTSTIRIMPSG